VETITISYILKFQINKIKLIGRHAFCRYHSILDAPSWKLRMTYINQTDFIVKLNKLRNKLLMTAVVISVCTYLLNVSDEHWTLNGFTVAIDDVMRSYYVRHKLDTEGPLCSLWAIRQYLKLRSIIVFKYQCNAKQMF